MFILLWYSYFSILCGAVLGLYSSDDDVVELTSENVNQMLSSDGIWFVEFYAPWCGHCQKLAPEWKKVASALKGVVEVAAVNTDEQPSLTSKYNIKSFPTILIFAKDKLVPIPYTGARNVLTITNEALQQVKRLVESRVNGESSDRSGGSRGDNSGGSDVIELTDSNFDEIVLNSEEPWLVEFYAPWCGHCKNLKPHWDRAATELKGVMKVGAVDATVHNRLSQKYGIRGFPTIKFFDAGKKMSDPVDYEGGRTSDDIVKWAQDKADALLPAPEVLELTSPSVFSEACEKHSICVISVLPTLYDCQSECRQNYLKILKEEAERLKKQKWGWIWAEALKQPNMEQRFEIGGSGYPAMVAVHSGKKRGATLRGAFSKDGIHEFLRALLLADPKMPLFPIQAMPEIQNVAAWDGQDAPPIEEDEIDLAELGLKVEL
ncbi:hypothetical protein AHF37_02580 [Paragonimus kellicotti]|nr:hypothetical protein AHF37_02580 [Paragonimus kellicotti]